ncbi:MAG: aldolase/citrate lyase family protein [Halopseudomonas aestusnigri]
MCLTNRRKELKHALRTRKRVLAAWTSLSHPSITEIFTRTDVDFVGIDIEHSTISLEQSRDIIATSQAGGSLCLPRIASHDMESIKRLLDSGADGIIAPMVSNVEEAQQLIDWIKFSPRGKRSFGVARAHGYGFDFQEYTSSWNDVSSFIVQIENVEGINNIDEIARLDEIDGCMAGPYDLSGSLGVPGQIDSPEVKAACQKVIDACKAAGKACGTQIVSPTVENVTEAFEAGFTFVVLSSDVFLLWKWAEQQQALVKQVRAN